MSLLKILVGAPRQTAFVARRKPQEVQRPRRAEAREVSANALILSRPAAGPPAHVVAHADVGTENTNRRAKSRRGKGEGIGGEGCKIKGGLAGIAQVVDLADGFVAWTVSPTAVGLATRVYVIGNVQVHSYPDDQFLELRRIFP